MTATQTVLTPTVRTSLRRWLFWVGVVLFAGLVAFAGWTLTGSSGDGARLAADNPAPAGGMAVAEVLRQQGVDVVPTASLAQTQAAVDDPATTAILLYDEGDLLSMRQLRELRGMAGTVIVVDPSFGALAALAPGTVAAGAARGPLDAACDDPIAGRAGAVLADGAGYRLGDAAGVGCYPTVGDAFALLRLDSGVEVLGLPDALSNEQVARQGNAALALGLLGQQPRLLWYLPSPADLGDQQPTLGDLTPPWVPPAIGLLVLTAIAAAVWRGRRFGPLVIENLPVTVKASETMLGRARLYEISSARLRALDALRVGSIGRLALACGLPSTATVDDVIAGVASATGRPLPQLRALLLDDIPTTDADLVRLSDALLTLEHDVTRALRP